MPQAVRGGNCLLRNCCSYPAHVPGPWRVYAGIRDAFIVGTASAQTWTQSITFPPSTMSATRDFDAAPVLSYLSLPDDYQPSPQVAPVEFLRKHIRELPPHLLVLFSANTTPKERTVVPEIRSRRLKYIQSKPLEFALSEAKSTWPALWEGRERPGTQDRKSTRLNSSHSGESRMPSSA